MIERKAKTGERAEGCGREGKDVVDTETQKTKQAVNLLGFLRNADERRFI